MHARFAPKAHRFDYRVFLFAVDLDELDVLSRRLWFFSRNRRNLYSFRDGDYLPTNEAIFKGTSAPGEVSGRKLKGRVIAYLNGQGINLAGGRVLLVTLPRLLGYVFNPVSFYFCYDRAGIPVAALAEVTNTFKEMKPYLLGPQTKTRSAGDAADAHFRLRTPKHFYVSPFSDVDVAFDFALRPPGDRLAIQIDDYATGERTLTSTLTGSQRPLTDARLAWFTFKYPLLTLRIVGLIHWHALRLWLKRVPWFAKAARAADQRDLYRPHGSLGVPPVVPPPVSPRKA